MAHETTPQARPEGRFSTEISGLLAMPSEVAAAASSRLGLRFLIILGAVFLGLLLGFVDVLIDAFYFRGGGDVLAEALRPSGMEIYIRGMYLLIFLLFGLCSSCKKIRDEDGEWYRFEKYIHEHSGADFTHGYCPECSGQIKMSRKRKRKV